MTWNSKFYISYKIIKCVNQTQRRLSVRNKVALAVSTALMSVSLSSVASVDISNQSVTKLLEPKAAFSNDGISQKFFYEKGLAAGEHTYIVRLNNMPIATYDGSIPGLAATNPKIAKKALFNTLAKAEMSSLEVRNKLRLDLNSKEAVQYANFLESKQNKFLSEVSNELGKDANVLFRYKNAFNGMALRLTQDEAAKLASFGSVAYVERERMEHIDTDQGPIHVGATQVWQGEGPSATNMGEGVIIGVVDTGVNTDHPSFADIGGDDYDHTNPKGAGNYVGDCAGDYVELCNDKLIGVRSYPSVVNNYDDIDVFGVDAPAKNGEDYNGHGSHTASTSGGNIIKKAPLVGTEGGKETGDGIPSPTGFKFEQISGVAPHANIISYQICSPGNSTRTSSDTYAGCPGAAIVAALDDAIADGVDVINYSISGGGNPWVSSTEQTFLAAQEAGIFAAVSAGNSGPGPRTTPKNAPWYTVVGASTHGRTLDTELEFNDVEYKYTPGSGPAFKNIISAPVKAAVNIDAANLTGCSAFAADSFKDSIALISRGACGFADKVNNATAAGAKAVVVHNNRDGDDHFIMGALDEIKTPAVMISENSGTKLLADLANNATKSLSIDPAIVRVVNAKDADVMAGFSSRGSNNTVPDIMTPSVTAPGVSIYAAYSDEHYGHDVLGPSPADYNFLQGTSMSAPHTAGAGAVLKSAHPTWTPDNIRSALMMTASTDVRKEDAKTAADVFDMGSGSIRVNLATNTGLIMDETFANYQKANPAGAGTPSSLNIPSMADTKCIDTCTWTRTFTATKDASWTVAARTPAVKEKTDTTPEVPNLMKLTVSPASFDIKAGETQTITVTADVKDANMGEWNFGDILLTADGTPDARLPVLTKLADNNLPASLDIAANRAEGSMTYRGLKSGAFTKINASVHEEKVAVDANFDTEHRFITSLTYTLTADTPLVSFATSSTAAPDIDLRIRNSSGVLLGSSAGPNSTERVTLANLPAADYTIQLLSFKGTGTGIKDPVNLKISKTEFTDDSKSKTITAEATENADSFDVKVNWKRASNSNGLIQLKGQDEKGNDKVVALPWSFSLGKTDVADNVSGDLKAGLQTMVPGKAQAVLMQIAPNHTNDDKVYKLTAEISDGHEIANVNNGGTVSGNKVTWEVTREVGKSAKALNVGFDLLPRKSGENFEVKLSNSVGSDTMKSSYKFGVINVAPVAKASGTTSAQEYDQVTLDGSGSTDANNDDLTYSWMQLSGTPVTLGSSASVSFTAPGVSNDETLSFQLTVTDSAGNSDTTVKSVSIVNKKESGSFGWLMLLLTPMLFTRRKKAQ